MKCKVCNGLLKILGALGLKVWYRCEACGIEQWRDESWENGDEL